MAKELFADRLKQSMENKGFKQIDIIRIAAKQGVKLGKSHMSQYVSGNRYFALSGTNPGGGGCMAVRRGIISYRK